MELDDDFPYTSLRTMQIITIALFLGAATFLGIVVFQNANKQNLPPANPPQLIAGLPILTFASLVFFIVIVPISFLAPRLVTASNVKKIAAGTWQPPSQQRTPLPDSIIAKLVLVAQTAVIIGAAPLEGAAFFANIAYMLEGNPVALGVVGTALLLILSKFPTAGRLRAWLDLQQSRIADLKRQQLLFGEK